MPSWLCLYRLRGHSVRPGVGACLPVLLCLLPLGFLDLHCFASENGHDVTSGEVQFAFASPDEGTEILQADDDFMSRLSPFDLQSRLRSEQPVTLDAYKKFVATHVVDWSDAQRKTLRGVLADLDQPLQKLKLSDLPTIQLIQTTGREESGAAYTRANAIILTGAQIGLPDQGLKKLILHELFHVISRSKPELRDDLYDIIGFQPSNEILLPEPLAARKITNPDAPVIEHVITLKLDDQHHVFAAPVLYASSAYAPQRAQSMFAYLTFKLMQVDADDEGNYSAAMREGEPVMLATSLPDYQRQIGKNTNYIIHPEEVLADNFAELMLGNNDLPDPWITERMAELLLSN